MADIFISYSRKDQVFVRKLHSALTAEKHEGWVDWEGIPPSIEWEQEIDAAIDAADSFIFVLSPDSATSEICRRELSRAQEAKKRLVPVVRRDVSSQLVPEELKALNWIFFREEDDFSASLSQLIFALDTDFDYWRMASQSLVSARRWQARNYDRSLTLRGKELEEAERWLAEGATKQPSPTKLQAQFIAASRRAVNLRQRFTIGLLSAGLAITLILSTISLVLYGNEKAALQVALSHQFAAESRVAMTASQPDLALLYSTEALKLNNNLESRQSLFDALTTYSAVDRVAPIPIAARSPRAVWRQYSDYGATLVTLDADGVLAVWNTHTQAHRTLMTTSVREGIHLDLSPDGKWLLISGVDPNNPDIVQVWDVISGRQLSSFTDRSFQNATGILFQPTEHSLMLAVSNVDGGVEVSHLDMISGALIKQPITLPDPSSRGTWFSPSGRYLAVTSCLNVGARSACNQKLTVKVWDLHTDTLIGRFAADASVSAFSPDETELLTNDGGNTIVAWNVGARQIAGQFRVNLDSVSSMVFSPDGLLAAFTGCIQPMPTEFDINGCAEGRITLGDVSLSNFDYGSNISYKDLASPLVDHIGGLDGVAFSDSTHLIAADSRNIYTLHTGTIAFNRIFSWPPSQPQLFQIVGSAYPIAFSSDGTLLGETVVGRASSISDFTSYSLLWHVTSGRLVLLTNRGGDPAFRPDGNLIAVSTALPSNDFNGGTDRLTGSIQLINPTTQYVQSTIADPGCGDIVFSRDGGQLLAVCPVDPSGQTPGLEIVTWDAATSSITSQVRLVHSETFSLANDAVFSPDGLMIAFARANQITVWNVKNGAQVGDPLVEGGTPTATASVVAQATVQLSTLADIAFSPDGTRLAAVDSGGRAWVWDVSSRKLLTTVDAETRQSGGVSPLGSGAIGFSYDGRYLAISTADNGIIWDVGANQLYLTLPQLAQAGHIAFSPSQPLLAWSPAQADLTNSTQDLDLSRWQGLACQIANRDLTAAEWQRFAGSESFQAACPVLTTP